MGLFNFLFGWLRKKPDSTENDDIVSTATSEPIVPERERTPAPPRKKRQRKKAPVVEKPDAEPTPVQQTVEQPIIKDDAAELTDAEAVEVVLEDETEGTMPERTARGGRFEIKRTRDDRYVFNLFASNHVIIATSQVYSSVQSALNGIKSVIANAEKAPIEDQTKKGYTPLTYPKWEVYQDNGGQFRFRLSASNGSCVCHSQGYTTKSNARKGIESIIKFAKNAEIDKVYLKK